MAMPAFAATLSVTVDVSAGGETQRAFAIRVEAADGTALAAVAAPSRSSQLELPPGTCSVSLSEPRYWAEPRAVYVGPDGASVRLLVYPEVNVQGRVTATGKIPTQLMARFQSADANGPRGETACTIVQRSFSCAIPAARLDLALKAQGFVTRYRWGVDAAAKPGDIGVIDLVPGAVLTGYVSAERGVRWDKAVVRATPLRAAPAFEGTDGARSGLATLSAPVNARGFFHFDGIAPGDYTLEASAGTRRSVRHAVRVIETAEAELREPLVLEEPHDLAVSVHPSRDPYNRRWIVELERRTDVAMRVETERQESLSAEGRGTLQSIPAGQYTLVVRSEGGETWAQRELTVPDVTAVEITLPRTFLRGLLTLDGKPLQAALELHHRGGAVAAHSAADGRFALFFPEKDVERIERVRIRSDEPRVDRTLDNVPIDRDDEGNASVRVELPPTYLAGVVVDAQGKPVSGAIVRVESPQERGQEVPAGEDGTFEIHALAPGTLRLRAYAAKAISNAIQLEVAENGRTNDVRLVVRPTLRLTGRVLSASGPLPGAAVYGFPQPGGAIASPIATTGPDGRYDIALPPETTDVDIFVSAPSFATQFFRQRLAGTNELDLRVTQSSGTLVVETADIRQTLVHHRGAVVGLSLFAYHGGIGEGAALRIPSIEPGSYLICNGPARCETVTVVPHGQVRVRLE